MSPEQVELVQTSWEKVKPIADKAAELFYGKLFEMNPDLQPLFKGDMTEQGKKLMSTISLAVSSLERLDDLIPALTNLGAKHAVEYNVPDESYETVGGALLWTLEQGLGDDFTEPTKEAWTLTYQTLSGVMLQAAADARC
ncbi:MAG: globin family protein [Planctomycetota bacterium]